MIRSFLGQAEEGSRVARTSRGGSAELARALAGGTGALCATLLAHYVNVIVGDAVAALMGFALGYALAARAQSRRSAPHSAGLARVAGEPPQWIWFARRAAVVAAALALLYGDRALYAAGVSGLLRKLLAVALAAGVLAAGAWLFRWPRRA